MESEKIGTLSMYINISFSVLLFVGLAIFSVFGANIFIGSFPFDIWIPKIFIIFIPLMATFRAIRRRQSFSTTNSIQQLERRVNVQLPYYHIVVLEKMVIIPEIICKYLGEKIFKDSIYYPQCRNNLKKY